MEFVKITNRAEWEGFLAGQTHASFLRSWAWGEMGKKSAGEIERWGLKEKGRLVAAVNLIKTDLPFGRGYFYCPRGPIGNETARAALLEYFTGEIARRYGRRMIFLRFEPEKIPAEMIGGRETVKTIDIQPAATLLLDLALGEKEIFGSFHQKTRYNIRLAVKKGVEIVIGNSADLDVFWPILKETARRDDFRLHNYDHYRNLLDLGSPLVKLMLARQNGRVMAGIILANYGDTVTYLHGASLNSARSLMAPHLLQWTAIKQAMAEGFRYYDFYGVDEKKWPGVTRFKKSFGGRVIVYPGTYDLVLVPGQYRLYRFARALRRGL